MQCEMVWHPVNDEVDGQRSGIVAMRARCADLPHRAPPGGNGEQPRRIASCGFMGVYDGRRFDASPRSRKSLQVDRD